MTKEKILVIVGPTAIGKTALGVELAKTYGGEVVSGDSMQVYKDLDIGTAKVTHEEMEGIPHHLIDIHNWDEDYSASQFQKEASRAIEAIQSRSQLPIVVGGTGLYIESLIYNVSHGGKSSKDVDYRKQLEKEADLEGGMSLWLKLESLDPEAASSIHPNNLRRTIRALEVIHTTGSTFSSFQHEKNKRESRYQTFIIGLNTDRSLLYERINKRVDIMVEEGVVDEALALYQAGGFDLPAAKAIGYKEFFPYFEGNLTLEAAVEELKKNSRRYAKRQLTWFRNRTPVDYWLDLIQEPEKKEKLHTRIEDFLKRS